MVAWSIEHDERRGRLLQAAQHFSPGQQILSQSPYAMVLYDDQQPHVCDHTTRAAPDLKRCGGCKLVWYASRDAQKAAWPGHKRECRALARIAPRVPPATVRLAARVLWRAESETQEGRESAAAAAAAGNTGRLAGGTFAEVQGLEHHWAQLGAERKTSFAQMAGLTRLYMYGEVDNGVGVPTKDIAQLLAAFACNNHTICNTELQPLGVGLYPTGAMVNHSCRPNAVQSFDGGAIVFRAVRPIKPGKEVTISYTDLKATRPERRAFLLQHYHFDIDAGAEASSRDPPPMRDAGTSGAGPRLSTSVSQRPPGVLDEVDGQLAALPQAIGERRITDAFMMAAAADSAGSDGAASAGFPGAGPGSSRPRDTFDSMEAALAALEAGEDGLDPRQHVRVRCWGRGFFKDRGSSSGSGSDGTGGGGNQTRQASAASSAAAGTAASIGGTDNATAEAADTRHDDARVDGHLVNLCNMVAADFFRVLHVAEQRMADNQPTSAASALQAVLAHYGKALGPHHRLKLKLRDVLLRAAVAAQQWDLALQTARELLPTYNLIYPQPWPELGLLWAHIAKVAAVLDRDDEAAAAAETAAQIMQITSGDCDVVHEMLRLRHDIGANMRITPD